MAIGISKWRRAVYNITGQASREMIEKVSTERDLSKRAEIDASAARRADALTRIVNTSDEHRGAILLATGIEHAEQS